jgi:hypothetical protein
VDIEALSVSVTGKMWWLSRQVVAMSGLPPEQQGHFTTTWSSAFCFAWFARMRVPSGATSNGDAVKLAAVRGNNQPRFSKEYIDELPLTLAPLVGVCGPSSSILRQASASLNAQPMNLS